MNLNSQVQATKLARQKGIPTLATGHLFSISRVNCLIAIAVSEPEAKERRQLFNPEVTIKVAFKTLFAKGKELW